MKPNLTLLTSLLLVKGVRERFPNFHHPGTGLPLEPFT